MLVSQRIQIEGRTRTVSFLMDEQALSTQAEYYGLDTFELAEHYRSLGLNGIAIYEETLSSLTTKGDIVILSDSLLRSSAVQNEQPLPDIAVDSILLTELREGVTDSLKNKHQPAPTELNLFSRTWLSFEGTNVSRPAGPDTQTLQKWADAGWDIAYRPRNYPNMINVGADYPKEAHYLIYHGLQISGYPSALENIIPISQNYITGVIEGTEQKGLKDIIRQIPSARVLSFNQDYLNEKLSPESVVDKYLLGADERGIKLIYVRPYTETQQGDMIKNTEKLITLLKQNFEAEGYTIGSLPTLEFDYQPSVWLRALSSLGIVAGLALLALLYPGAWAILVVGAVAGLGLFAGGLDWDALALMAAVSFPVLGYGFFSKRLVDLGLATLISLVGVVLLVAVGSDQESMLAIRPFAGVAATLVIPPLLFLFHYALKFRRPAQWVTDFWTTPIQLGHVAIFVLGMAALGLIVLRRGNFPIIGASEAELALRSWLSDFFVRPRFKELIGHPLGVLGLHNNKWPEWIRVLLLTGGVIAQGTIMNSFSHYHTPFIISLQRTLIALFLGLLFGLILLPISHFLINLVKAWLASGEQPQNT